MPTSAPLPSQSNYLARRAAPFVVAEAAGALSERRAVVRNFDPRVARIKTIIRSRIHLKLTLRLLAGEMGLSVSRLCHLFKAQTDIALARYLKQFRMDCARDLLEITFLSVKEISARVGLTDVSHFVRDFEKTYGLSPSRYRLEFLSRTSQCKSSPFLLSRS